MRQILTTLLALAMLASACGSATEDALIFEFGESEITVEEVPAAEGEVDVEQEPQLGTADTPITETTTTVAPEALRTGREAILANHSEGKPYVLWYWGSH